MNIISETVTATIRANIEQILREGGTPQCSIWAELPTGQQFQETLHLNPPAHTNSNDYELNNTVLYCIGSLTKTFIAYALVVLVEKLARSENPNCERFRDLRDAWKQGIRKYLDVTLPGDPTIDNLLSHFNGLPSINDFLFAPDGTLLLTKEEFPEVAEYIASEDDKSGQKPLWRYGNGGYILAGLLIEKYSGVSLAEFLEDNIFRPFEMTSTCASLEDFDKLPQDAIAQPHIISVDLSAEAIEYPRYFKTPAFAAMGVYSCTKDIAAFFRRLFHILANESTNSDQDVEIVKRFLHPYVAFKDGRGKYGFCGQYTNLCSTQPGNGSLNRLVTSPGSNASRYKLGLGPSGVPLEVLYNSGMVTGYESCYYLMPELNSFVIVLSNATGLVDTSDHVSRLLLQELFDLKYRPSTLKLLTGKIKRSKSVEVNFIEKARLGSQERCHYMSKFFSRDSSETGFLASTDLIGRYTNDKCHQTVEISSDKDGALLAQICGTAGRSRQFIIILIDEITVRLRQLSQEKSPFLSIDCFADWKLMDFVIERDSSGNVTSLSRARKNFSIVYTRSST